MTVLIWLAQVALFWVVLSLFAGLCFVLIIAGYQRQAEKYEARQAERKQKQVESRLKGEIAKQEARNRLGFWPRYVHPHARPGLSGARRYRPLRDADGLVIGAVEVPGRERS